MPDPRPVDLANCPDLEAALEAVNRDLAATLPEAGPMRLMCTPSDDEDIPDQFHAALPDGRWHDGVTHPAAPGIAEAAQETVQAVLWQVWPVCPEHRTGVHADTGADERAVWWCRIGEGHELCEVGELAQTLPGKQRRALRRKERRGKG
ncbi:hypothetical protein E5082_18310 [Streptomyces griseoluteus]|uniref:Uncharacterized protein n=2 Tax=Streptomyces griseoluteus TaxID=29306 RepID=A0A4Z1DJ12_STRGP|nr:hypothetical protein [Streptomyces griseoluteus]TGN82372.1 hypothetical protein E5082_18310 [Streptomyces griseoluteus]